VADFVHLKVAREIGRQHGQLLAAQIEDTLNVIRSKPTTRSATGILREAPEDAWPHIDAEYQQECRHRRGALQGAKLMSGILSLNGVSSARVLRAVLNAREKSQKASLVFAHRRTGVFAFIAMELIQGGKNVIAHNNGVVSDGERWTVMFDIQPEHGHRILMDGMPA